MCGHGVEVQVLGLHRLLACEDQELAGQGRGELAGALDLFGVDAGVGGLGAAREQGTATEDHGQEVVEVVRDASRQGTDRFHFLSLAELGFELQTLGEVAQRTDQRRLTTVGDGLALELGVEGGAVGAQAHDFDRPLEGLANIVVERLAVVLGDELQHRSADELLRGDAEHRREASVDVDDPMVPRR